MLLVVDPDVGLDAVLESNEGPLLVSVRYSSTKSIVSLPVIVYSKTRPKERRTGGISPTGADYVYLRRRRLNRAKYAAIGAAVGAALGGLMSREAASTVAGIGALAGANLGESRALLTYEELKRRKSGTDSFSARERWFANEFAELFGGKK